MRIVDEARYHDAVCMVSLTFRDECLPPRYSVSVSDVQLFMKRLRFRFGAGIRFFACGEYGEKGFRPHYHVILFGLDFRADRKLHGVSGSGEPFYNSAELSALWPYGFAAISDFTVATAGYVARYALKKVRGKGASSYYYRAHPLTGEMCHVSPEFVTMSRMPGLGTRWFEEFGGDAFPSDFVVKRGVRYSVPRFYLKKLADEGKEAVLAKRRVAARARVADTSPARLAVRQEVVELRAERLKRD
ncbi:replication initiator protein [Blackfly microvirus SF02]|uniref:Replication initiator protein n=1 Tax=Blackfly microvirus SF02 TaxID=2576452 RepID=A0A4P8PK66_9VIRU|nr:replication initiator protein [Blackfly microvirus SF02]